MAITRYKVVEAEFVEEFEAAVAAGIAEGFQPSGSLTFTSGRGAPRYAQAMVKRSAPEQLATPTEQPEAPPAEQPDAQPEQQA